jgi:hypothetical protein
MFKSGLRHATHLSSFGLLIINVLYGDCCCNGRDAANSHPVVYSNENYGYNVTIPSSKTIRRSVPPNPDHGFEIVSSTSTSLWVGASYTESITTLNEVEKQTDGCHTNQRQQTTVGGTPAIQLYFSCPAASNQPAYSEFLVLTVQKLGDRSPATYEIAARALSNRIPHRDFELVKRLVNGFSFTN